MTRLLLLYKCKTSFVTTWNKCYQASEAEPQDHAAIRSFQADKSLVIAGSYINRYEAWSAK